MINLFDFLFGMLCGVGAVFVWGFYKAWWEDMHD
jgi:hypothetical protein